jgi:nucleotide-binding universal stress UspA family protein
MSEKALDVGIALAASGGIVDVLHCWYLPPMSYPYYAPTKAASELVTTIRDSITAGNENLGKELLARHGNDRTLTFHQVEAAPAQGIQEWLETHEYGLIVSGSHGRRGAARLLLGSVAEKTVRHAPCSVLVVHDVSSDKE